MVKNSGKGGKKHKRSAAKTSREGTRELLFQEDGQSYARITDILGNCRFKCECQDGKDRLGTIRGKLRKKVWMTRGDIVLVGLREFQDDKCDIIHKYTNDETHDLRKFEEITFKDIEEEEIDDTGFQFGSTEDDININETENDNLHTITEDDIDAI